MTSLDAIHEVSPEEPSSQPGEDLSRYSSDEDSMDWLQQPAEEADQKIDLKESQQVCCARSVLVGCMLIITMAVSFTIYYSLRKSDEGSFEEGYKDDAKTALDGFLFNIELKLRTAADLSMAITSFALMENKSFPFVNSSDLTGRGRTLRKFSDSLHVGYSPLLDSSNRDSWEQFAEGGADWKPIFDVSSDGTVKNTQGDGPFFPLWHR